MHRQAASGRDADARSSSARQELTDVYLAHNATRHDALLARYPGVEELLAGLQADGRTIGIVTSKRRNAVDLALDLLGITTRFDVIVSWEDTDRHKPLPDPLLEALRRLDVAPADAVYLGDTAWDIRAARAAGVVSPPRCFGVWPVPMRWRPSSPTSRLGCRWRCWPGECRESHRRAA